MSNNIKFSLKGWRTMGSAPTNGEEILVIETPNHEAFNVFYASYMNYGRDLTRNDMGLTGWWDDHTSRDHNYEYYYKNKTK